MLAIFAGPVISDTAFYSIIGVSFLTVASFAAVVLSLLSKFLSRNTKSVRKISIQKSLLITTSVIVVGVLVFIVIPTILSDYRWDERQAECAIEAGYASPSDDNNPKIATAASQSAYDSCLE